MTQAQINFAAAHDWYVSHDQHGTITVLDTVYNEDGLLAQEPRQFSDFDLLLTWAGY